MPSPVDLDTKRKQVASLRLDHLQLLGPVSRLGRHLYIAGRCGICGQTRLYLVNNLQARRTKRCRCQRSVKYGRNPLAEVLGQRYDAIRQRHGHHSNFPDRASFIWEMLALAARNRPEIRTPKQLRKFRITRLNNRRGFEKGNLCLVRAP
jgi:hypothetical protein